MMNGDGNNDSEEADDDMIWYVDLYLFLTCFFTKIHAAANQKFQPKSKEKLLFEQKRTNSNESSSF